MTTTEARFKLPPQLPDESMAQYLDRMQELCGKGWVIGYEQAQGTDYYTCKLANTGTDNLLPMVLLMVIPLVVVGAILRRVARKGRVD